MHMYKSIQMIKRLQSQHNQWMVATHIIWSQLNRDICSLLEKKSLLKQGISSFLKLEIAFKEWIKVYPQN